MSDETVCQTEVRHGDQWFFVSTIERDSSAMVAPPPRYYETLVWEWDRAAARRGAMVGQYGSGARTLTTHCAVVQGFHRHGKYEEST